MKGGFTLLWSKTLLSSLWIKESKETRLVWVTLLMMKDSDGIIQSSVLGLKEMARVSMEECQEALRILLSPDPEDTSKVEEGRRIREVPGGWQIINHDMYRFSTEAKREFWRNQKAEQRAKNPRRKPKTAPRKAEQNYNKAVTYDDEENMRRGEELASLSPPGSIPRRDEPCQ